MSSPLLLMVLFPLLIPGIEVTLQMRLSHGMETKSDFSKDQGLIRGASTFIDIDHISIFTFANSL